MSRRVDRAVAFQPGRGVIPAKESPIEAATANLLKELNAGHTEHFKDVLRFYGRLYQYSYFNCALIYSVKPDARVIASYKKWQELGRQVRQGAAGAMIFVPVFRKETQEDGSTKEVLKGFTRGRVFSDKDLTDIETNPLPDLWKPLPDDARELYADLVQRVADATGYRVRGVEMLYSGAKGECDHLNRRISILKTMDSRTKCSVLLHECVHARYHGLKAKGVSTQRREFEAEACSYVLSSLMGIESIHAADYILHWKGTAEELRQSLSTIHKMCRETTWAMGLRVNEPEDQAA